MTEVSMVSSLLYGSLDRRSSLDGSVARAEPVSMIRLTHSIWTEVRGGSLRATPPRKTMNMATQLTVSWNWRNSSRSRRCCVPT